MKTSSALVLFSCDQAEVLFKQQIFARPPTSDHVKPLTQRYSMFWSTLTLRWRPLNNLIVSERVNIGALVPLHHSAKRLVVRATDFIVNNDTL